MSDSSNDVQLKASVEPPASLFAPLRINGSLQMTPGPTGINPRVSLAMAMPVVSHVDPQFLKMLEEVSAGLRYAFQTTNQYTFAVTGSATCAMEMAICNLLERGDTFLVAVHGLWGQRAAIMGQKHGFNVVTMQVNRTGDVFERKQFEDEIERHKPKLIYVCHGDSSTGTLQQIDFLGRICHQYDCLVLIDAVMTLSTAPLKMDEWEVDAVFSGAQKGMSAPPGVSMISLSPRAVQRINSRQTPVDSYYMDVNLVASAWGIVEKGKFPYHYTPAVTLLYGLREALAMLAEEGLENVIKRHAKCSKIVQNHLKNANLTLLVRDNEHQLPVLLAVEVPPDVDGDAVRMYLYKKYRITIAGGLGPTAGQIWRIGVLGENANILSAKMIGLLIKEAVNQSKKPLTKL